MNAYPIIKFPTKPIFQYEVSLRFQGTLPRTIESNNNNRSTPCSANGKRVPDLMIHQREASTWSKMPKFFARSSTGRRSARNVFLMPSTTGSTLLGKFCLAFIFVFAGYLCVQVPHCPRPSAARQVCLSKWMASPCGQSRRCSWRRDLSHHERSPEDFPRHHQRVARKKAST